MSGADEYATILADARAQVAARRTPDADALRARVTAVAERRRAAGGEPAAVDRDERETLKRLERVLGVHRARGALAERPSAPSPAPRSPARPLRAALRSRPTIVGNLDIRREQDGEGPRLVWAGATGIADWEVRFSERPDARSDYALIRTLTLPADARGVELPLGDRPLRVHVHGRRSDGRVVRRALISGLTHETWAGRWERRPTAS